MDVQIDEQTDGRMYRQTNGGDYNIPFAFLKKRGDKHIQNVTIIFDTGSHRTYITESLAKILNFKKREVSEINLVTFGSENPQTKNTAETAIGILLKAGSIMNTNASVVPSITGSIL